MNASSLPKDSSETPKKVETLLYEIQKFMQPRYSEGYVKGVHDHDAAAILEKLIPMYENAGVLKYNPDTRATALLAWDTLSDKGSLEAKLHSRRLLNNKGVRTSRPTTEDSLYDALRKRLSPQLSAQHIAYLVDEFSHSTSPVVSSEAHELYKEFQSKLTGKRLKKSFTEALTPFDDNLVGKFQIALDWVESLCEQNAHAPLREAAYWVAKGTLDSTKVKDVTLTAKISGLKSDLSQAETYVLDFNEFLTRLEHFSSHDVPTYQEYIDLKVELVEQKKEELRLNEFKPHVMSAFVRNRLINEVYLPLVGDNLAKQIGTAGKNTRTDRMGLLLLISPPGYGKTTLMEYIANRLGLTFVKINGPAIGHHVTSLDPAEAPNASAREEVEKLNLALEMGDNIMLYLDDIQQCL